MGKTELRVSGHCFIRMSCCDKHLGYRCWLSCRVCRAKGRAASQRRPGALQAPLAVSQALPRTAAPNPGRARPGLAAALSGEPGRSVRRSRGAPELGQDPEQMRFRPLVEARPPAGGAPSSLMVLLSGPSWGAPRFTLCPQPSPEDRPSSTHPASTRGFECDLAFDFPSPRKPTSAQGSGAYSAPTGALLYGLLFCLKGSALPSGWN